MLVTALAALGLMLLLAAALGWLLGWADKALAVETDPRITMVAAALPGANCGACGCIGCADYAEAVVTRDLAINLCPVGGPACHQAIGAILGKQTGLSWPMRPVVHCTAHTQDRLQRRPYHGEPTCRAMNLVSSVQGCTYGCLGCGDCVRACNYDAIHVIDGLATVDYVACVGCGACAKTCPRNIISMVPFKAERILAVKCSNKDFGKEVTEVCNVGCIGCGACAKAADVFEMIPGTNLPRINYERYDRDDQVQLAVDRCPRKSLVWVGKPTPADLAATKDDELPHVASADFKTTVDQTEWRG